MRLADEILLASRRPVSDLHGGVPLDVRRPAFSRADEHATDPGPDREWPGVTILIPA